MRQQGMVSGNKRVECVVSCFRCVNGAAEEVLRDLWNGELCRPDKKDVRIKTIQITVVYEQETKVDE